MRRPCRIGRVLRGCETGGGAVRTHAATVGRLECIDRARLRDVPCRSSNPLFGLIASTDALATLARLLGYAGWGSTGFVLRSGLTRTLVIHPRQPHVLAQSYVFVGALPLFVPEGALRP